MIKSMTAFAGTERSENGTTVTTEIRGYNSRYLDVMVRLPAAYTSLEEFIKQTIGKRIFRGRIEIRVGIKTEEGAVQSFTVNKALADAYCEALQQLKHHFNLHEQIGLHYLANVNGIIEPAEIRIDMDTLRQVVENCLTDSLDQFEAMRITEGQAMKTDLDQRIEFVDACIDRITGKTDGLLAHYQERLKNRIESLTKGMVEIDPARVAQEAAFLADKSDISEELTRSKSHLKQFRQMMAGDDPAGKPLNFLLQELSREFNTMGVKAANAEISHIVVSAKTELEKLREQVQNIE